MTCTAGIYTILIYKTFITLSLKNKKRSVVSTCTRGVQGVPVGYRGGSTCGVPVVPVGYWLHCVIFVGVDSK